MHFSHFVPQPQPKPPDSGSIAIKFHALLAAALALAASAISALAQDGTTAQFSIDKSGTCRNVYVRKSRMGNLDVLGCATDPRTYKMVILTPSATTPGSAQAIDPATNQWIDAIWTAGVPSLSQPAFSNLAGSVAAVQMPALIGDVTTSAEIVATTIAAGAATNAKLAADAVADVKGAAIQASKLAFMQISTGAVQRTFQQKGEYFVFVEDFGAVGDGVSDDRAAVQAAINANRRIFFKNLNYRINGGLTLPNKQELHGFGSTNTDNATIAATRLIFDGTATAAFSNSVPSVFLGHGGLYNLSVRVTGIYDYVFDFNGLIEWAMVNVSAQTTNNSTAGLRSLKINPSDNSWLNTLDTCRLRLPDASTKRPLEHDWSDSTIINSSLQGGIGSLDKGYGVRYIGNNIERSSDVGLTILKNLATQTSQAIGNYFDGNAQYGVKIDTTGDATFGRHLKTLLMGNAFRTVKSDGSVGKADVIFVNPTGNIYTGVALVGNQHTIGIATPIIRDSLQWEDIMVSSPLVSGRAGPPLDAVGLPYRNPAVIAGSAVAIPHTGRTSETTLATIPVPGKAMGANGALRITVLVSHTNNANNKRWRIKLGSSIFLNMTATTTASGRFEIEIRNRNAYNAQVAFQPNYASWGFTDSNVFTAAIDTSIDQNLTITAELADSADTMTLESYTVEVLPGQ